MNDDADNRGPQDAAVEHVSVLKYVKDESIGMIIRFGALDRLMDMGIEDLAGGFNTLDAVAD